MDSLWSLSQPVSLVWQDSHNPTVYLSSLFSEGSLLLHQLGEWSQQSQQQGIFYPAISWAIRWQFCFFSEDPVVEDLFCCLLSKRCKVNFVGFVKWFLRVHFSWRITPFLVSVQSIWFCCQSCWKLLLWITGSHAYNYTIPIRHPDWLYCFIHWWQCLTGSDSMQGSLSEIYWVFLDGLQWRHILTSPQFICPCHPTIINLLLVTWKLHYMYYTKSILPITTVLPSHPTLWLLCISMSILLLWLI